MPGDFVMTNVLSNVKFSALPSTKTEEDEKFDIPIDIADIINICKEYSMLGWQIQNQIEQITTLGIEKSIKSGAVKVSSLVVIKDFLYKICENAWFGDAANQANDCISLIEDFELRNPELFMKKIN